MKVDKVIQPESRVELSTSVLEIVIARLDTVEINHLYRYKSLALNELDGLKSEMSRIKSNYAALTETYQSCLNEKNVLSGENKKLKETVERQKKEIGDMQNCLNCDNWLDSEECSVNENIGPWVDEKCHDWVMVK